MKYNNKIKSAGACILVVKMLATPALSKSHIQTVQFT